MFNNISIILIIFLCVLNCKAYRDDNPSESECSDRIHRKCTHTEKYTEQDIDNARIWLQKRYAKTNPQLKPCAKLHVRKDIKCLSKKEVDDLTDVVLKLYANGVIDRFTEIHRTYWPIGHKFSEGMSWHRIFTNEMEKEMMKINPRVTMPYWKFESEFIGGEKSIIFDYFGHAGTAENNFCITDGPLANIVVNYPERHCVKREWNPNMTLPFWEGPEWKTAILQMGIRPEVFLPTILGIFSRQTPDEIAFRINLFLTILSKNSVPTQIYTQFSALQTFVNHFKTHLSIGGWAGDMSVMIAPNDFIFYPFHTGNFYSQWKWQLQNKQNLVPESYTLGAKLIWDTQVITGSDINKDNLTYYSNVTLRDAFQVGFGDQCYIYDSMIKPINDMINKVKPKLPDIYYRLKRALPRKIFEKYFPKFAFCPNEVTYFDYDLPDVGNCNSLMNGLCRKMPVAQNYSETANGRRQFQDFITVANFDISPIVLGCEDLYWQFMKDINESGYCSPYA